MTHQTCLNRAGLRIQHPCKNRLFAFFNSKLMDEEAPESSPCHNCGSTLTGVYCAQCGQRDLDFRRDWRGLVSEISSTFLHLDGKVPQGLFALLFRPGYLTKRFLEGARASQIPPLRLYLFVSLGFFIWIAQSPDQEVISVSVADPGVELVEAGANPDGAFETWLVSKLDDPKSVGDRFVIWLPRAFLIGVPLLALFSRLLFWRQPLVYLEHLVLSLHLQSFAFLWILLTGGVTFLLGLLSDSLAGVLQAIAFGWLVIYPIFAFRRLFQFRWGKAIGISIVLEVGYLVFLVIVIAVVALGSLYFA